MYIYIYINSHYTQIVNGGFAIASEGEKRQLRQAFYRANLLLGGHPGREMGGRLEGANDIWETQQY